MHDWKLDLAVDNYFQLPDRYNKDPKVSADKRKIELLFNRYRGTKYKYIYKYINIIYKYL